MLWRNKDVYITAPVLLQHVVSVRRKTPNTLVLFTALATATCVRNGRWRVCSCRDDLSARSARRRPVPRDVICDADATAMEKVRIKITRRRRRRQASIVRRLVGDSLAPSVRASSGPVPG